MFVISSCAIVTDEYQSNKKKLISFLLEDIPMPKDSEIIKDPTKLLGTGDAISGRIKLSSPDSPAENLIFYESELPTQGWTLKSSRVGETITLVYSKNQRYYVSFLIIFIFNGLLWLQIFHLFRNHSNSQRKILNLLTSV